MSSILTGAGGGRTYGFDFDLLKSPSPSIRPPSHTSSSSTTTTTTSASSTISESSNSPLAISTRKSRAPRKRPNQTYNEAAALLSTAYPNLFPNKNLKKPGQFSRPNDASSSSFLDESAEELFLPFRVFDDSASSFLLQHQIHQNKPPKALNLQENSCQSPGEIISGVNSLELNDDCDEGDFDAESILDEEIDEGIDSIIGSKAEGDSNSNVGEEEGGSNWRVESSSGIAKFDFRLGFVKALRRVDDGNWWNFPAVEMVEISPRINNKNTTTSSCTEEEEEEKKKKTTSSSSSKPKVKVKSLRKISMAKSSSSNSNASSKLMLKLNYENVLSAWSDRGSPFAEKKGNVVVVGSSSLAGRSKLKSKNKKV